MRRMPGVVAALAMLVTACDGAGTDPSPTASPSPSARAEILTDEGTVVLEVEIADTDLERRRGLMGRTELGPDQGMVFVFEEEAPRSFWMKDTRIPLSIAFYDASGRIVSILDMVPCRADPCPLYRSEGPAAGAIEANLGFFDRRGVEVGDVVRVR